MLRRAEVGGPEDMQSDRRGLAGVLVRLVAANVCIVFIVSWVADSAGGGHLNRFVLLVSLVLWVAMPIAIAQFFRAQHREVVTERKGALRILTFGSIVVGMISAAVCLGPSEHLSFWSWQLAAGSFAVAASCLAVDQAPPLLLDRD